MMRVDAAPIRQAFAACRVSFLCVGVFSFAINALLLTGSLYMLQVYDRVLTSRSLETLVYLNGIALLALLVLGLLDIVRSRILVNVSVWLEQKLAPHAFEQALANSLRGRSYRSDALRDVRELRTFFIGPGLLVLFDLPSVPLFLLAITLLHPVLGLVATIATLILLLFAVLNDQLARRPLKGAIEAGRSSMRHVEAGSRNAEVVDALGMLSGLMRRWNEANVESLRLQAIAANRAGVVVGLSKFCRLAVQSVMLGVGAWLVLKQELTGGAMVAGSIILSRALAPVEQGINTWKGMLSARSAYQRLKAAFAEEALRPPTMPLPAPCGALRVEHVHLAKGRPILHSVSFALAAGESLAVIGPSGAGKTTLARLLIGITPPTSGHVRLDDADLFQWNRTDISQHIGYLPQDVELFSGTVAENIARLDDGDPAVIVKAAKLADVHDMILRLPQGYDTEIGEAGAHLSGGQRQRLALARALYGNPRLVVLDEPNANLDYEGEMALIQALNTLKVAGATSILITHRPALIAHVDKILVLRDGRVEVFGPRQEVLEHLRRRAVPAESAVPAELERGAA